MTLIALIFFIFGLILFVSAIIVIAIRNSKQTLDHNMCEPVTECKRGQHVWVWKEMSPIGLHNIWQCQKCKAQKTISVFDT